MPMLAIKAPEQMWGTQDRVAGGKVGEEELGQPLGHPLGGHNVLRPSEAFAALGRQTSCGSLFPRS